MKESFNIAEASFLQQLYFFVTNNKPVKNKELMGKVLDTRNKSKLPMIERMNNCYTDSRELAITVENSNKMSYLEIAMVYIYSYEKEVKRLSIENLIRVSLIRCVESKWWGLRKSNLDYISELANKKGKYYNSFDITHSARGKGYKKSDSSFPRLLVDNCILIKTEGKYRFPQDFKKRLKKVDPVQLQIYNNRALKDYWHQYYNKT